MRCLLCQEAGAALVWENKNPSGEARRYYQCGKCRLIFLDPAHFLSPEEEKERYDLHENDPKDKGYVDFLNQLIEPLFARLEADAQGLDYGCGPGPTVSVLMNERGHAVADYDPIYFPDRSLLDETYDFVTCTEVIEHFYNPPAEFELFQKMTKKNGLIGLMSAMYIDIERFKGWWYHREPTHVCFYHRDTFDWIANRLNWIIEYVTDRVIIYRKLN